MQQAYQHWEGSVSTPIIGRSPRAQYITTVPTARPFVPLLTPQTAHLPTALCVTSSGARASFRAWKWNRTDTPSLTTFTPSTPPVLSTDNTVASSPATAAVAATAAAAAAAAAAATVSTSQPLDVGDVDYHFGEPYTPGMTSRNSLAWPSIVDPNFRFDSLKSVPESQNSMRPAIAATAAALDALSPFLTRSERAQLRQTVAATTPLNGLSVVLDAARAACNIGSISNDSDTWSNAGGRVESNVVPALLMDEQKVNISTGGNTLENSTGGWISGNTWNGSMWQNDGRQVAWRALSDDKVNVRDAGTGMILPAFSEASTSHWELLNSSTTTPVTGNARPSSTNTDLYYKGHASQ